MLPELVDAWSGFDMEAAVTGALGVNQRRAVLRLRLMIGQRAHWQGAVDLARSSS